ncbi:hypothetical protein P0Y35_11680 [Kiritimatiellaeota bacterium B1221]|nr:hypothetical protein [Kiritimatiellaeota bacterium B1221]
MDYLKLAKQINLAQLKQTNTLCEMVLKGSVKVNNDDVIVGSELWNVKTLKHYLIKHKEKCTYLYCIPSYSVKASDYEAIANRALIELEDNI